MFIGSSSELDKLNRLYHGSRFQMTVIYGRRRIGKKPYDPVFYRLAMETLIRPMDYYESSYRLHDQMFRF